MTRACALLSCLLAVPVAAQHEGHHGMTMDRAGIVMNANHDRLPRGCDELSGEERFTIHAGSEYAREQPGIIFGMSRHEVQVPPCSRVTIRFVNDDQVRHQWMVHGLPKYLYPAGMFHIEAMGGHEQTGTFIVPPEDRTYLIHCDLAQHMEKGMRGQLVVGEGSGDLWAVPGVTDTFNRSPYLANDTAALLITAAVAAFALTAIYLFRK